MYIVGYNNTMGLLQQWQQQGNGFGLECFYYNIHIYNSFKIIVEEITKSYIENPTLTIALTIAVLALTAGTIWLVKWILNKLITALENNTAAMNNIVKTVDEFRKTMQENTDVMSELTVEQKLINQNLQNVLKR